MFICYNRFKNLEVKTMMEKIERDEKLVAYCGFYCGACPKYKTGKHNCQGCRGITHFV